MNNRKLQDLINEWVKMVEIDEPKGLSPYVPVIDVISRKHVIDKLHILVGAMILDGYDEFDSCVKYVNELIKELENE